MDGSRDGRLPLRPFGRTGLRVSPLGLAALSVRGPGTSGARLGPDDVERAFHEHGVNAFLVHPMMKEQCEGVRRLVRAGHRESLVLASEASFPFAGSIRRGLERHLRALGVDALDVWLMGWVRGRWYVRDAAWSEMVRLREQGLVRAIGLSSHDRPLAAALARELGVDVLMVRYNAAHRGAEREVFDALADLGADRPAIVAYTATRWGMLLRPAPGFPTPMTGAECYRFVLDHPMVDLAWCAARTPEELREDVAAALAAPLDPARRDEIVRFGDAVHASARRGWRWMFGATAS